MATGALAPNAAGMPATRQEEEKLRALGMRALVVLMPYLYRATIDALAPPTTHSTLSLRLNWPELSELAPAPPTVPTASALGPTALASAPAESTGRIDRQNLPTAPAYGEDWRGALPAPRPVVYPRALFAHAPPTAATPPRPAWMSLLGGLPSLPLASVSSTLPDPSTVDANARAAPGAGKEVGEAAGSLISTLATFIYRTCASTLIEPPQPAHRAASRADPSITSAHPHIRRRRLSSWLYILIKPAAELLENPPEALRQPLLPAYYQWTNQTKTVGDAFKLLLISASHNPATYLAASELAKAMLMPFLIGYWPSVSNGRLATAALDQLAGPAPSPPPPPPPAAVADDS